MAAFSAAAAATSASKVSVINKCDADLPIFVWTTAKGEKADQKNKLEEGDRLEVAIEEEGLQKIKLTSEEELIPGPQLALSYGIKDNKLLYDVYTLYGTPTTDAARQSELPASTGAPSSVWLMA